MSHRTRFYLGRSTGVNGGQRGFLRAERLLVELDFTDVRYVSVSGSRSAALRLQLQKLVGLL